MPRNRSSFFLTGFLIESLLVNAIVAYFFAKNLKSNQSILGLGIVLLVFFGAILVVGFKHFKKRQHYAVALGLMAVGAAILALVSFVTLQMNLIDYSPIINIVVGTGVGYLCNAYIERLEK